MAIFYAIGQIFIGVNGQILNNYFNHLATLATLANKQGAELMQRFYKLGTVLIGDALSAIGQSF